MFFLLLLPAALAGEWAREPIDPKVPSDYSAYTLGFKHVRVGLFDDDVGVWSNVDVGTTPILFVLGVPNAHAKIGAVQSKVLDIAVTGAWHGYSLEKMGVDGGYLNVIPLGLTSSWSISRHLSIHAGASWLLADIKGQVGLDEIAGGLATAIGVDLSEELDSQLSEDGALYAGANVMLTQAHLGADWRFNRRDALVLQTNTFLYLSGTISGGYATEDDSLQAGATVHLKKPLTDQLQSVITVSWQFSWKHWYLRVGLPVPTKTIPLLWIPQAFELNYVF